MRIVFKENKFMKGSIKYYVLSFSYNDCDVLNLDREGRVISFVKDNGTPNKITFKKGFDGSWLGIKRSFSNEPRIRFILTHSEIEGSSRPAARTLPERSAASRASVSTTAPRETLMT